MKKNTVKKLKINKKAVATLNKTEMDNAKGGQTAGCSYISYVQRCGPGPTATFSCNTCVSCRLTVC